MSTLYIASYGKDDDKGIYIVDFTDGKLTLVKHVHMDDFPSYIITKNNTLYASLKNAKKDNTGGGIAIYDEDGQDLTLRDQYSSAGRSYTHLCVSDDEKYLFTANYHGGATASYLLEDRKVAKKIGAVHHIGLGPDLLKRQLSPHVHNVGFTPDKEYVYAVDLGSDKVVMYKYIDGVLQEDEESTYAVIPGTGPRHMIFSKDGRFAYLINEISNSIMVFKYVDHRLTLIQATGTLPSYYNELTSASAIRLTKSGTLLLASNRGYDTVAMYRVNQENGKITFLSEIHTGKEPRDFNIIDDKYMIVGAQSDNRLEVYTLDVEKETIQKTNETLDIPAPVCITE